MKGTSRFSDRMKAKILGGNRVWTVPGAVRSPDPVNSPYHAIGAIEGGWQMLLPDSWLSEGERGLVLTDFSEADLENNSVKLPSAPVGNLHAELIFYDKIDVPDQRILGFDSQLFTTLKKFGIAQRTLANANGDMTEILRRHSFEAYLALDAREAGRWAMGRSVRSLGVKASDLSPKQAVQFHVSEVLPIFSANVDLDAVLEFKKRRWSELLKLRASVDDLASEISTNGTNDVLETAAFRRFQTALADHMRVMGETNYEKVKASFSASFSWESLAGPAAEFMATGAVTLVGAVTAGVTIGAKTVDGLVNKKNTSPFEYLTSANRELG